MRKYEYFVSIGSGRMLAKGTTTTKGAALKVIKRKFTKLNTNRQRACFSGWVARVYKDRGNPENPTGEMTCDSHTYRWDRFNPKPNLVMN
jgi:hypothetical protein